MKFPSPSEEQGKIVWTAVTLVAVAVILALVGSIFVGLGWLAKQLSSVLLPLAVAGVIAYLLDPVVDYFQSWQVPRSWAIILVFFLAVLLQAGMVATVVPKLASDTAQLREDWPDYQKRLRKKINGFIENPPFQIDLKDITKSIKLPAFLSDFLVSSEDEKADAETLQEVPDNETSDPGQVAEGPTEADPDGTPEIAGAPPTGPPATDAETADKGNKPQIAFDPTEWLERAWSVGKIIGQWFVNKLAQITSWFGLLAGFALVPVYVFYFLAEKKGISDSWTDYLPIHESKIKEEVVFVLRSINDSLIVFFRSQVLVAMCVGILLMIGFSIINLRYGVLLGFVAGFLGIVPYLGVMLSIVPAVTISIIFSDGIWHPLLTLGVFGIVQMLEGLVISPKIIGDRVGLHPLTVIISIMVGTTLFGGITGGVLAIPLTAALRTLMFRYVWRRREWHTDGNPLVDVEVSEESHRSPGGEAG